MPILFALAVALFSSSAGHPFAARWWPGGSRGERVALASGLALGVAAYLIFFFGWSGQLRLGLIVAGGLLLLFGVAGIKSMWEDWRPALRVPSLVWLVVFGAFLLLAVVAALAPPTALEWDSLAYHLALPKIWLVQNRVVTMPYDHHSYFPQLMEMLFTGGLAAGGFGAAKLMHTWISILAVLAAGGFVSRVIGSRAGLWAALSVACCPMACWEAGTAYIDMATALYTVLALLLLHGMRDNGRLIWLAAVCAGLTAATKYTGLLTIGLLSATSLVWLHGSALVFGVGKRKQSADEDQGTSRQRGRALVFGGGKRKQSVDVDQGTSRASFFSKLAWKPAVLLFMVGLAVASPWYIRTTIDTGNPVYPFAYSIFKGRYWSARNAEIYRAEQVSFGVGKKPWELPRVPWDLTTRPEAYFNQGGLIGALGLPLILCAFLLAAVLPKPPGYWYVLGFVGLNLVAWYWMSQQARYILALAPALAVFAGSAAGSTVKPVRLSAIFAIAAQAAFVLFFFGMNLTQTEARFLLGANSMKSIPQYQMARAVNTLPNESRIALYDEVMGYYLDRRYFWANPGHSTVIPYQRLSTPEGLLRTLKLQGFTHVLVNLAALPPDLLNTWRPMLDAEVSWTGDLAAGTEAWRRQLAWGVQHGYLAREGVDPGPRYRLYRITLPSDR